MASANESQGLKIAVAAFLTLSVILAVTSYFLYSTSRQRAKRTAAAERIGDGYARVEAEAPPRSTRAGRWLS